MGLITINEYENIKIKYDTSLAYNMYTVLCAVIYTIMKAEECKLNEKYRSRVNRIANGCKYEVIKKNKTSCWVILWEDGKPTNTIYKNVRYSVLAL